MGIRLYTLRGKHCMMYNIIILLKTPVLIHPRESNKLVFSKISTLESSFEKNDNDDDSNNNNI